jgi:hypothetical protein
MCTFLRDGRRPVPLDTPPYSALLEAHATAPLSVAALPEASIRQDADEWPPDSVNLSLRCPHQSSDPGWLRTVRGLIIQGRVR